MDFIHLVASPRKALVYEVRVLLLDVEDQMEQIFYDFASRIKNFFIPTSRRISRQDTAQFMF